MRSRAKCGLQSASLAEFGSNCLPQPRRVHLTVAIVANAHGDGRQLEGPCCRTNPGERSVGSSC